MSSRDIRCFCDCVFLANQYYLCGEEGACAPQIEIYLCKHHHFCHHHHHHNKIIVSIPYLNPALWAQDLAPLSPPSPRPFLGGRTFHAAALQCEEVR